MACWIVQATEYSIFLIVARLLTWTIERRQSHSSEFARENFPRDFPGSCKTQVRENATLRPEFFLLYDQILDYYVTNGLSQTEE
jgi:hypothetical protein